MEALHLSAALGAFVAGVMLADSPYRHELEADIEPFRSLLLGLFFVGVGMMLDVDAVVSQPHVVLGLAVLVIAIKTLAIWSVARMFGMRGRSALSLGLLLSQGGEFGFVLFAQRSEEHTSELQSLMRISYAVFCLKKKKNTNRTKPQHELIVSDYT